MFKCSATVVWFYRFWTYGRRIILLVFVAVSEWDCTERKGCEVIEVDPLVKVTLPFFPMWLVFRVFVLPKIIPNTICPLKTGSGIYARVYSCAGKLFLKKLAMETETKLCRLLPLHLAILSNYTKAGNAAIADDGMSVSVPVVFQ